MTEKVPAVTIKRYCCIRALWAGWRTVEELESMTGLSRPQIFRVMKKIKQEYDMEINSQVSPGTAQRMYRIIDLGILHPERFEIFMINKGWGEV